MLSFNSEKKPKGFTLIELLVVMAIIAIIGGVIMSILFSVVRGTNKANKLIVVRQNGNYAIAQMTKIIRGAKMLQVPNNCDADGEYANSITVIGQDDRPTKLELTNNTIASTSAYSGNLTDISTVKVTNLQFSCSQASNSNTILVTINFDVTQALDNPGVENAASLHLSTSVALRNYQ